MISLTMISRLLIRLIPSVFVVWGWWKGSVIEWCFFLALYVDAENIYIYIPTKCTLFQIMHRNREQNIIQCHYNNIWKHMCIKTYLIVMIPIFDPTYKEMKQVEIYIRALYHELVLLLKSRNYFQIMIPKGKYWDGTTLDQSTNSFYKINI